MQMQAALSARPCAASRCPVRTRIGRVPLPVRAFFGGSKTADPGTSSKFYSFELKDIDGRSTRLDKYKGKVVLVVNLASQCGFTPQYSELTELDKRYKSQGLAVAGFPCNQFGGQEPGSNSEIKRFAQNNYNAKFDLFSKVDVNGASASPLFEWLKQEKGGIFNSDVKWNLTKFLIDREGRVVGRYPSTTSPLALENDIKKLL